MLLADDSATMLMGAKSTLGISGYKVNTVPQRLGGANQTQGRPAVRSDHYRHQHAKAGRHWPDQESRRRLRVTPILGLTTESQQAKRDEANKRGATGWPVKRHDVVHQAPRRLR